MKKIIVVVLLLFVVGHPPRADATTDTATTHTTVTFIANPNLPKPTAPGLPPGNSPNEVAPKGTLPKTGATQTNLIPAGTSLILLALMLFISKKRAD